MGLTVFVPAKEAKAPSADNRVKHVSRPLLL